MRKLIFAAIAAMVLVSVTNVFAQTESMTANMMPVDTTQTDTVKTDTAATPNSTKMYLQADTTTIPVDTTATPTDTVIAK